jgi:hypothetical protein
VPPGCCVPRRHISLASRIEEFKLSLQKQRIHLRGAMTRTRVIKIKNKIFGYQIFNNDMNLSYKLSNVAGHGAFVFLAVSYLDSDFLQLRLYAMSGISLSIIFQYYRDKPLWIPIRWNAVFLLINVVMIALLLRDDKGERSQR